MTEEEDSVLESLKGSTIQEGGVTEDGLHILLEDGRVVIFCGQFIFGITRPDKQTLQ